MPTLEGEEVQDDPPQLVWRGGDPIAFSRVIARLREAGIPHEVMATSEHLVFELGMPRPFYQVKVLRSHLSEALALVAEISDTPAFGLSRHRESDYSAEENQADASSVAAVETSRHSDQEEPSIEVWAGDDSNFAEAFQDCLGANEIVYRIISEQTGNFRVFVGPSQESRAREILREMTEGVPPS
jgi:hypothetical protein